MGNPRSLSAVFNQIISDDASPFLHYYWRRFTDGAPPSFSDFATRLVRDLAGQFFDIQRRDISEQVQIVIRTLEQQSCLLAIDQFDSVIDAQTDIPKDLGYAQLLRWANQGSQKARVLITAWQIPKDSEEVPFPSIVLQGLEGTHATRFLKSKLVHQGSIERDLLKNLQERVQGHPYALELIARNYESQHLKLMLADDTFFHGTLSTISSLVASKVVSRLGTRLRQTLASVCIFSNPTTIEAVASVSKLSKEQAFEDLGILVQRGIISVSDRDRYDVHALVGEHVLESLSETQNLVLHESAARYFLSLPFLDLRSSTSIDDVRSLLDALDHLLRAGLYEEAWQHLFLESLAECLFRWGYYSELQALCLRFERSLLPTFMNSILLGWEGMIARDRGNLDEAKIHCEQALELAKISGDARTHCLQLVNLGDVLYYRGEFQRSLDLHQQAMELLGGDLQDQDLTGRNLGCLANVYGAINDKQSEEMYYQKAAQISRAINDRRNLGIWLGNLGAVFDRKGEKQSAID